jgi:hypothetical protein
MITICQYCKRQLIEGSWVDSLPIDPSELVSHGMCPICFDREMIVIDQWIANQRKEVNNNEKD